MAKERALENVGPHQGSGARSGRPEFVEFRNRLKRLVDSLVALRDLPAANVPWTGDPERVEVKLEAEAVVVEFVVARLPWEKGSELVHDFQSTFANPAPVFLDSRTRADFTLRKSREKDGSYGQFYLREDTSLSFGPQILGDGYLVKVQTNLTEFNDHFEVFVTDAARTLFPPIEKPRKKTAADLESWQQEIGRSFERMGCRVLGESELGWKDLTGLDHLRERLERSVFRPLARENLYQKVARRVMPHPVNVLPRGVLLHGPPGCGKTWSMKVIAGEADLPVVVLPCDAVLTKWYGESENRLASVFGLCREAGRMILLIDELDALARHRSDSHETTARMVSILLAEMDGLAESSQVLLVGSANSVESIDPAVLDRFDLQIEFGLPDGDQLRAALAYYAQHLSTTDVAELVEQLDGWNFRRISRFAEEVIRSYVSNLDLNLLEAGEPPLPGKEDYLAALAGFR